MFKVWKTVELGTGLMNADDFRKAIKESGMKIGDSAEDILDHAGFAVASQKTKFDLVRVTVAELGFKNGARKYKIYNRAEELGLKLCPIEVGPQLRLQYMDQPKGEWGIIICINPVDSKGKLQVFDLTHNSSGRWLHGRSGRCVSYWHSNYHLVFVLPHK